MIPIFDEHQYAVNMNNGEADDRCQFDKRCYTRNELLIYTKWLYWNIFAQKTGNDRIDKTKSALINFCNQLQLHFNQDNDYKLIEYCLQRAQAEKLRPCNPCYITKREWSSIMNIPDDVTRKVYFTCLVIAKFYRNNRVEKVYDTTVKVYKDHRLRITQQNQKDILKLAGIKYKKAEIQNDDMIEYSSFMSLVQMGLIEPRYKYYKKRKNIGVSLILCDADIEVDPKDIYLTITSYNNIINYYYCGMHEPHYKICKKCGAAFKDTSKKNNNKYCNSCSNGDNLQYHYKICIDCGTRILVKDLATKTCRCSSCQKKHKIDLDKKRYLNKKSAQPSNV